METKVMAPKCLEWFVAMIIKCGFTVMDDYFQNPLDIQLSFPDARVRPLVQFRDLDELDFKEISWSPALLKEGDQKMRRQEKSRRYGYLDECLLYYYTKYHHSWWEKIILMMSNAAPFPCPPNHWGWELSAVPPDKTKKIICLGDSTIRDGERLYPVIEMIGEQHRLLLCNSADFNNDDKVITVKH